MMVVKEVLGFILFSSCIMSAVIGNEILKTVKWLIVCEMLFPGRFAKELKEMEEAKRLCEEVKNEQG